MKLSAINVLTLSGLSALATATDIFAYTTGDCFASSGRLACHNVGPGFCCNVVGGGPGAGSGSFQGKLTSTTAGAYQITRNGDSCGALKASGGKGSTSVCLTLPDGEGTIAGLKILSSSSKRDEECIKSVLPDTLTLGDGHNFNLTSMAMGEADELWALTVKGASIDSIPAKYLQHKIL